jgi:hypothetical protein
LEKETRAGSGAAACSMQASEAHWFMLSESPTNITVFPRHRRRKSSPSNLGRRQAAGLHRSFR